MIFLLGPLKKLMYAVHVAKMWTIIGIAVAVLLSKTEVHAASDANIGMIIRETKKLKIFAPLH